MKNKKLAISIPTYNRAEILKYNLLQIVDELIEFDIPVYISDDSTNEETRAVIDDLKAKYHYFYYRKNEVRFGHDLNCLNTILFPDEEYVWYMGDSMIIKKGSIKRVLDSIKTETFDFIACNADGRNLDAESKLFTDGTELFANLCWHLTMTGATIYNKKRLFDLTKFDTTKFKNFPQTAIIFEQFALKKSNLLWINERLIFNNPSKNSYWASQVFEVFIDDFKSFLYHLPDCYSIKSKDKVLVQHSVQSGVFNYHSFVVYRIGGYYNNKIFRKYRNDFKKFTSTNSILLQFLSIVSVEPLKIIYQLIRRITLISRN